MAVYLGVDIGGSSVKAGLVSDQGELLKKKKYRTADLAVDGNFVSNFVEVVRSRVEKYPEITSVGIGVPGIVSKDRRSVIDCPNIPGLANIDLVDALSEVLPGKSFFLDNDANAAALGELLFGGNKEHLPDSFVFLTLGTGLGGGIIFERKIFKGGNGNSMEIGHIVSSNGHSIEENIGKHGLLKLTKQKLVYNSSSALKEVEHLTFKDVEKAALEGDVLAMSVFMEAGTYLGEAIVASVRILDMNHIVIGGGVAETLHLLRPKMEEVIFRHLTPYYTDKLVVELATLGNDAGIVGAASLCMQDL